MLVYSVIYLVPDQNDRTPCAEENQILNHGVVMKVEIQSSCTIICCVTSYTLLCTKQADGANPDAELSEPRVKSEWNSIASFCHQTTGSSCVRCTLAGLEPLLHRG